MKNYHIVYYENQDDLCSRGVTIAAASMLEAVQIFEAKYGFPIEAAYRSW